MPTVKPWHHGMALLAAAAVLFGTPRSGRAAPGIVFVSLAAEAEERSQEQGVQAALMLLLDDREVTGERLEADAFRRLSTAGQVELLGEMVARREGLAAIWLDLEDPALLRAQLVFVGTARAVVRLLEVPRGPEAAQDLALATREVLATTELEMSLPAPAPPAPPPEPVVAPTENLEDPEPSRPPRAPQPNLSLGLGTAILLSGRPAPAPAPRLDGALSLGIRSPWGLSVRLAGRLGGTVAEGEDRRLIQAGGQLELHYAGRLGSITLGPAIGLIAGGLWYRRGPADEDRSPALLDIKVSPTFRLGLDLPGGPRIEAAVGANLMPIQHTIRDRANGAVLFQSDFAEVHIYLGLEIPIQLLPAENTSRRRKVEAAGGMDEETEGVR